MGFIPDIERICKLVPFTRQTLFFSATMPPEITRLTETVPAQSGARRSVAARRRPPRTSPRRWCVRAARREDKRATLRRMIRGAENFKNAIIFCNRKRDVQVVYRSLEKHGFSVGALHGDLDQRARMAALDAFRNGQVQLLVCSDVAARGLDIPDVSHVINYDAPHHSEDYVHRIGRTGRAGKTGHALTIVTRADARSIAEIEKLIARKIEWQQGAEMPAEDEAQAPAPDAARRTEAGAIAAKRAPSAAGRIAIPNAAPSRAAITQNVPRRRESPRKRNAPPIRAAITPSAPSGKAHPPSPSVHLPRPAPPASATPLRPAAPNGPAKRTTRR